MKRDFLTRLFATVSAEEGAPSEAMALNQLYERIQETDDLWDPIERLLLELDVEELSDFENAVTALAEAFEKQGFINGFRLGMLLREELGISGGVTGGGLQHGDKER